MNSIITILDEATTNKIAAGEVVERPASCVKELVENAIDAGASAIEIEIADGGQSYMRVTDNGCGMSADDAHKCIIRHATSKIRSVEDIYAISSLGFRGEAVPSIAAVSHLQITTRQAEDTFATHLLLDGGKVAADDQMGAAVGTTMEVRDLFYNTPARKKFLKSERTESGKINEMIIKLALAHPSIEFTFINNGRTAVHTGGNGQLLDTIANIYGTALAKEIFPVTYDADDIHIEGYVGKPSVLKSSRAWQTCIVNHRIVHNLVLFKAIENAYHAMLPKSGYPFAMLHLQMDPASIDVNVHPAKTEIKFSEEQAIYRVVYHGIIQALMQQEKPEQIATVPHISSFQAEKMEIAESIAEPTESTTASSFSETRPASFTQESLDLPEAKGRVSEAHDVFSYAGGVAGHAEWNHEAASRATKQEEHVFNEILDQGSASGAAGVPQTDPVIVFEGDDSVFIPLGQVAECFIIAKKGQDLYIIDQHAAHERIRYDTFCNRVEKMPSQQLLTAEFVEVDAEDMTLLLERQEIFDDLGYVYSEAGPNTLRMQAIPSDLKTSDIAGSLRDICKFLHEDKEPDKAEMRHRSLAYLSCHGAIKAGNILNIRQMKQLLEDLFHTDKPFVCPHGRPIILRFTPEELAKLFKRT